MARLELELDGSRLKAGADQAEKSLQGVKQEADRAEKSIDRLGAEGAKDMQRLGAETRKTAAAQTALTAATRRQGSAFAQSRGQIQNVSFQIGDFATQVGAGTAASVALGQQLPQLLGGFGALGAVLGAVVAIGVPLAASLFRSGEGAKSAADALDDLQAASDDANRALANQSATVEEIAGRYGVYTDEVRELLGVLAQAAVADQITALSTAVQSLEPGPLENAVDLIKQIDGATGPAAQAVAGLRQELNRIPAPVRNAAEAFIALQEADDTQEQAERARDLRVQLEALDDQQFNGLIASLAALSLEATDALSNVREQAIATSNAIAQAGVGRGGAGPGGPLIGSVDAQLLAQGITPSDDDAPKAKTRSAGGAATAKIDQTAQAYERLRSSLDPVFAAQVKYNNAVEILDKNLAEGNITLETHNEVLRLARERYEQAAQASGKLQKFAEQLEELQDSEGNIVKAGQALQQTLSDFLFNPFETGVRGMVLQFSDALRRMASDAIAAQITQSIFGAFGGFGGGSPIPLYDSGGYIPSGQAGMVAEKRPEVVNGTAVDMPSIVRGPAMVQGGASTARNSNQPPQINQKTVVALSTSDLASEVTADPSFETRVIEIGLVQGWAR